MRVIAGRLRGRTIAAPKGLTTRPTTDRVRESLFSVLVSMMGPGLDGASVLDAFAGTGALGIEALSRGARRAVFVEAEHRTGSVLMKNLESLGLLADSRVARGDVFSLARRGVGGPFSLILLDPPYTLDAGRTGRLLADLIEAGALDEGCVVSWEHPADVTPEWPPGLVCVATKKYGSTALSFARFSGGEDA